MAKHGVIIRSVKEKGVEEIVQEVLDFVNYREIVTKDCKVVIKVNLSTPFEDMAHASNTSPEILDAVLSILRKQTSHITVGESDGMRYPSEDAFEVSGFYPIIEKHGATAMNFSKDEWVETGHKLIRGWGLSKTLLDADVFITLPVLKTHATTVFTGSLKNQFGCYPQYNRILLHPHLDEVITLMNSIVKPRIVIMDGLTAMEGRGPINGEPRELGIILGGTDPVAVDATAMRLVGLDPYTSRHVVMASEQKLGVIDSSDIEITGAFDEYKTTFKPAERDLPIRMLGVISRSKFLTEKLIMNPESFYPLRSAAMMFRGARDFVLGLLRPRKAH